MAPGESQAGPQAGGRCCGVRVEEAHLGFPGGSDGKESACHAGDLGLIPGLGRSPGGGHATHSSTLAWRIPMDRGAWKATVHGVTQSRTRLSG